MNYENIIDFDNITLKNCIDLYHNKNISVKINDGRIIDLVKE